MRVVICNCPVSEAEAIATALVQEKIAACVNIIPLVKSLYLWQGKMCEEQEATLLIKIRKDDFGLLEQRIKSLHPYTIPEMVAINVAEANTAYTNWLYETTERGPSTKPNAVPVE